MTGPGKGDKPRVQLVSDKELEKNWKKTLKNKGLDICECGEKFSKLKEGVWWCKNKHPKPR